MSKTNKVEKEIALLNQGKEKPKRVKRDKLAFLNRSLLLKQTLISAWKTKLQLVILLLLTAFATALVTGSWISYQRVKQGETFMGLNEAKFDAVLPYAKGSTQIANEAFSLKVGKLYYQLDEEKSSIPAVYFDNSIIGDDQQINAINVNDLKIVYVRNYQGYITGISSFEWSNPKHPLTFNLDNEYVKPSLYGQLMIKANNAEQNNDLTLANHYQTAAEELYQNLFVNVTAGQILTSLRDYFTSWIEVNSSVLDPWDPWVKLPDDRFTSLLLTNRINSHSDVVNPDGDFTIPDSVNVATPEGVNVLKKSLLKEKDQNPRLAGSIEPGPNYGMNGQWMRIYRNFDLPETGDPISTVVSNFAQNYSSPSDFNNIGDGYEPNTYSYYFAQAAAALQNRTIQVVNQFVGLASTKESDSSTATKTSITAKIVNIGTKNNYDKVNLKVFEGLYPSSANEIVISPQYARQKHIKPGNTININDRDFLVSGIGGDAYNIYPTINAIDPVPNTRTEFVAYVLPSVYHDSNWFSNNDSTDISLMYFLPWTDVSIPEFNTSYFDDYFQKNLFVNNKLFDRNQDDYINYLSEKYGKNNPINPQKYHLDQNLIVTSDNSQFSIYNRGITILDTIISGFKIAAIVAVVFLVIIVVFITYLIIKKAIQKDQVSMGILKSAGYSTKKILMSYIAYPILVAVIAIPIGWIIGLVFQVYFTEIFNTMFILPYNAFSFNGIPLLIALVLIGGFVLITTLITGLKLLQKESLVLISNDSDISLGNSSYSHKDSNKPAKLGFKGRFLLSLSKTNWKRITVTAVVISVATLAITATISIPATVNSMKDNYFKTQKYKNYYQYQTPIPNMPLSKYALYGWNNLDNKNDDPFYPVVSTMPWPENIIIYDQDGTKLGWYNPLEYDKTNGTSNFADIFHSALGEETARDDIIEKVGGYLDTQPNGPLNINYLAWSYSWLGGRGFSNAFLKDMGKFDKSPNKNFSDSVINFASQFLPGIIGVANPGVKPGPDAITEILKQTLPGFIRQALDQQGPNAYDYFSIGHNTIAYNPFYSAELGGSQEELVTQLQLGSTDSNLASPDFLDISGIDPNTKMLVMNSNLTKGLKYNSSDTVVPMVINKSFAAKYNLSTGQTINAAPNVKTLYYRTKTGELKPLPKESWYYGPNPLEQENDKNLPWNSRASKWNYRGSEKIGNDGDNINYYDTYGYNYTGFYNKDGKLEQDKEPQSWKDINQLWLKLPDDIEDAAKNGTLRSSSGGAPYKFDIKNISYNHEVDSGWIKPFSFKIANEFSSDEEKLNPVTLLTARTPEWYGAMLDQGIFVSDNSLHSNSLKSEMINNFPTWWKEVVGDSIKPITQYKIIGVQNSYDSPRAYIDQKWANLVAGYSYYNDRSDGKDPTYNNGVNQWFSGKLSAADNIYDLIGRMSVKRNADDYSMYTQGGLDGNELVQIVASSDLLSKKQEMLSKMTDIAILASVLFIVTTILCSILIVIMITDSFLERFRRFMSQMKAEGYTNREINSFTLGIFTPWVFLGYGVGYGLGYLIIWGFIQVIIKLTGLALPFAFIWWIIPISFGIIALIYFSTFIINIIQLNKMNLISLLQTNN